MTSTPSQDKWRDDLQRLAELFEEKPTASTEKISTGTISMQQSADANSYLTPRRKQPSLLRRASRSLIIFCMGIAATLSWQAYGDATRGMIASSYPQFGWLVPQTVGVGTSSAMPAAATASDSQELLKSILVNLAALRQNVDRLGADTFASQQQMASEIAKLKAAERDFVADTSAPPPQPVAAPARKPVQVPPEQDPVR